VTRTIWLASYPKSGNTWLRMLIANLSAESDAPVDVNDLSERGGIASARGPFDHLLLIDSGLLTHDEIDALRPRVYEELANGAQDDEYDDTQPPPPVRFVKVHDAYTLTPQGDPLLAGARGASGAIVIVRDPRDVAPSLASHSNFSIDQAITFMNDRAAAFCGQTNRQHNQLRQQLPGWSGHVASWLEQSDIPVHLIRYEDMQADTAAILRRALDFAGWPAGEEDIARAVAFADFAQLRQQEQDKGFREAPRPHTGGVFFRRGEAGGWRAELNAEQAARIEADHAAMMRRLGYDLSSAPAPALARAG
jgi:aryl sulfotransferase